MNLIRQILPKLYILTLITTFLCGITVYFYSLNILLNSERQDSKLLYDSIEDDLNEYGNTEWYIDYWTDNFESMDIEYEDGIAQALIDKEAKLYEAYTEESGKDFHDAIKVVIKATDGTEYIAEDYSLIDPQDLPAKSQKLLAELAYLDIQEDFNNVKEGGNYLYINCLKRTGDESWLFLFSGKRAEEDYGDAADDIYYPGKVMEFSKSSNATLYATEETGEGNKGEAIFNNTVWPFRTYCFYYPLCSKDGSTLCVFSFIGELKNVYGLLKRSFIVLIILYVGAMMLCAYATAKTVKNKAIIPIDHIQQSVKAYGETQDVEAFKTAMGKVSIDNEIGYLSKGLSAMGDDLTRYIENVRQMTSAQSKMNTELDLANRIQLSALQSDFSNIPKEMGISMFGSMKPAKEVGGDFYDYRILDDDHIALMIGDVSGKGIPAALLMMISMEILGNECRNSMEPNRILSAANDILCDKNSEEMFVTAWVGILEISTGILRTANAGHENPFIKRQSGEVEEIKRKHGLVLAAMEGAEYEVNELQLFAGDLLMVYTDGVPEAVNLNNEQYGTDRLKKCLESGDFAAPHDCTIAVSEDVERFVGEAEQFDDTTMLVLIYKG